MCCLVSKSEGVSARMYIKFYKMLTSAIIFLFPLFLLVEDRYSIDGSIMSSFLGSICMALHSVQVRRMFDEKFFFTKEKELTILVYIKCLK